MIDARLVLLDKNPSIKTKSDLRTLVEVIIPENDLEDDISRSLDMTIVQQNCRGVVKGSRFARSSNSRSK